MEVKKTDVTKTVTVYVADDGKEFTDKERCMNYENRKKEMMLLNKINHLVISREPLHYLDLRRYDRMIGYDDMWLRYRMWYRMSNEEESNLGYDDMWLWYRMSNEEESNLFFETLSGLSHMWPLALRFRHEIEKNSSLPVTVIMCIWKEAGHYDGRMFFLSDLQEEFKKLYAVPTDKKQGEK